MPACTRPPPTSLQFRTAMARPRCTRAGRGDGRWSRRARAAAKAVCFTADWWRRSLIAEGGGARLVGGRPESASLQVHDAEAVHASPLQPLSPRFGGPARRCRTSTAGPPPLQSTMHPLNPCALCSCEVSNGSQIRTEQKVCKFWAISCHAHSGFYLRFVHNFATGLITARKGEGQNKSEKFRELVGKEAASKSGQFTFLNCFDMGSGSFACTAKEGVKLYVYNLRTAHMEMVRQRAIEKALADAVTEGLTPTEAAKQAQKVGAKAAKVAARQAKRILGPIISSGWDFFEAMYFGGSMTEGFLRGTGTLFGTYVGGFHGEERLGKLGYLAGSHLGSWVGGRIGLMIYDVMNGLNYMLQFVQPEYQSSSEEGSEYADNYRSGEGEDPTYYETSEEKQEESKGFSLF